MEPEIVSTAEGNKLKINEAKEIELSEAFRLFLISYSSNPEFDSEVYGRISLINFTVTESGLTEQLLSVVLKEEFPTEENERVAIMQRQGALQETLYTSEAEILELLSVNFEVLLQNDNLIIKLEEAKRYSDEAKSQIKAAKVTEEKIEKLRVFYKDLSEIGTVLYFIVQNLAYLEDIYQFSISWFIENVVVLSLKSLEGEIDTNALAERASKLEEILLETCHSSVCRGLLNKDKLYLSLQILLNLKKVYK